VLGVPVACALSKRLQATTSFGRRYLRPKGWPWCARPSNRFELYTPPSLEDLLQHRQVVSGVTFPSGFVPSGGSGSRAGMSTTIGVMSRLDRVFTHLCVVFYVKARTSVVIFFLGVLDVIVLPPPI
jgi:hypothetical protein